MRMCQQYIAIKSINTFENGNILYLQKNRLRVTIYTKEKTDEELIDYIKCMTITQNVKEDVYDHLTEENIEEIKEYINNPMTATTFSEDKRATKNREIITSEIIYYWMISLNIPPEYQKWHLNRLITLIRVCNIKNTPAKKRSKRDVMSRNAALNAARKNQLNTKG